MAFWELEAPSLVRFISQSLVLNPKLCNEVLCTYLLTLDHMSYCLYVKIRTSCMMQLLRDGCSSLAQRTIQNIATCFYHLFPSRLSESSFKVHVEKLSLEQRKMDKDKQLYLIPLEIKLKHSTVHMDERCPLLAPNPGVSAIHDYADWVRNASEDPAVAESEYGIILFTMAIVNLENGPVQINFRLHQSSEL